MNIAYHWKTKTTPILCMATGIARTASAMSVIAWWSPFGALRISSRSSSEGVSSLVRDIAVSTVSRMQKVPTMKHTYIQYGTPLPAVFCSADTFCRTNRDKLASTAPAPVNMLCVRNPRASWDLGSRSEMNARYGSIEVLLPTSSSQKQMTPSQSTPTNGNAKRMIEHRIAPVVMNGRRRPQRGLHVRSLIAPISGWMTRPVTGPARLRIGSCSGLAPISRKSGFTADWVRPKLNWTPKNPRFIIRIALVDMGGLRSAWSTPVGAESGVLLAVVVAVMLAPLADAILIEPERRCSTPPQRCAIPGGTGVPDGGRGRSRPS